MLNVFAIIIIFLLVVVLSLLLLAPPLPSVLIFAQISRSPSYAVCISYNIYTNTITVTCNANLSKIDQVVNDRSVLEKDPHGIWILNAIIKVNPLAKLTIDRTDTSWLKITNKIFQENRSNFISIYGNAKIDGVKITSWDPFSNNVIRQNVKGSIPRPYIIINKGAGSVNVSNSEIAFLGNQSFPSNGFLYKAGGNGSSIINNSFHDMWDGFYSNSAGFITIKNNKYYNEKTGISIFSSSDDKMYNNLVKSTHTGIFIVGNSAGNRVYNNTLMNDGVGIYFANDQPKNNVLENNKLSNVTYPTMIVGINNIGRNNIVYNK